MRRCGQVAVIAVITAIGLGGATACGIVESSSQRSADKHALTAGEVMVRGIAPIPARDAAWYVVGRGTDDTIEALAASGTTYSGTVVLRITVVSSESDSSTTCYRYTFTHSMNDIHPDRLGGCPRTPALTLTTPAPLPDVTSADRLAKLTALLHRLTPAQLADPSSVRSPLVSIFPPPISVATDRAPDGTFEMEARTVQTCVYATVTTRGQVGVYPGHGTDCRGG